MPPRRPRRSCRPATKPNRCRCARPRRSALPRLVVRVLDVPVGRLERVLVEIRRVDGDYEASVAASRRYADDKEAYDANPGGANTALQLQAYGEIAYEIYDELRDAPAVVAVPVSNGTTLAGIHKGFVSLYRRGKTSRMPRMVAGSSFGKNPIVQAWLKGLDTCEDLAGRPFLLFYYVKADTPG